MLIFRVYNKVMKFYPFKLAGLPSVSHRDSNLFLSINQSHVQVKSYSKNRNNKNNLFINIIKFLHFVKRSKGTAGNVCITEEQRSFKPKEERITL